MHHLQSLPQSSSSLFFPPHPKKAPVAVPGECPWRQSAFVPRCPFVVPGRNFACQSRLVSCRPRHTLHLPLTLPLAAGKFVSAATRFVKAQVTLLCFLQAENTACALAFPLPPKQALRGPRFSPPLAAVGSLPNSITPAGVDLGIIQHPFQNSKGKF